MNGLQLRFVMGTGYHLLSDLTKSPAEGTFPLAVDELVHGGAVELHALLLLQHKRGDGARLAVWVPLVYSEYRSAA